MPTFRCYGSLLSRVAMNGIIKETIGRDGLVNWVVLWGVKVLGENNAQKTHHSVSGRRREEEAVSDNGRELGKQYLELDRNTCCAQIVCVEPTC